MIEPSRSLYLIVVRCVVLISFVFVLKHSRESFHRVLVLKCVALVGGAIAALYMLSSIFTYGAKSFETLGLGLATKDNLASAGILGTTNTIASFMDFTVPMTLALVSLSGISRKLKVSAVLGLLLQVFTLVGTNSRGGIVALVGGILLAALFGSGSWRRLGRSVRILILALAVGFAVLAITPQPVLDRYASVFLEEVMLENTGRRLELLGASWQAFISSPIFGIGIGNVGMYDLVYGTGSGSETHNLFLQTLAEEGILAFFFLVSLLFILLRRLLFLCRNNATSQIWILAAFFAALLNTFVEPTFWHPPFASLFWLSIAVFVSDPVTSVAHLPKFTGETGMKTVLTHQQVKFPPFQPDTSVAKFK